MTERRAISYRPSRLVRAGFWVAGIASVGGMVAMILVAIEKVRTGHSLDTYRTFWLIEASWIGFFVFLFAAVAALAIGLFFMLKERRELRQLQAKYSGEHHG